MKIPLHEAEDRLAEIGRSSADECRPAALRVGRSAVFGQAHRPLAPIFSLRAPCMAGISLVALRRGTFTTGLGFVL